MILPCRSVPPPRNSTSSIPWRVALERLRNGRLVEGVPGSGAARELDVFIRAQRRARSWKAAGARVRTGVAQLVPGVRARRSTPSRPSPGFPASCEIQGRSAASRSSTSAFRHPASAPCVVPAPDFEGLNGAGVLIGDVDSGVDFDHGDFKNAAGSSRIVRIWDQTDYGGPPPASYAYGTEWSAADLDDHLARESTRSGTARTCSGSPAGTGAQTGGGVPRSPTQGMAPQADLVMVKTDFLTTSIVDGVKCTASISPAPAGSAVVNLARRSAAPTTAPATSNPALSASHRTGRIIVKSAGNDRGVPRHAEIGNAVRDSVTLTVAQGPDPVASSRSAATTRHDDNCCASKSSRQRHRRRSMLQRRRELVLSRNRDTQWVCLPGERIADERRRRPEVYLEVRRAEWLHPEYEWHLDHHLHPDLRGSRGHRPVALLQQLRPGGRLRPR